MHKLAVNGKCAARSCLLHRTPSFFLLGGIEEIGIQIEEHFDGIACLPNPLARAARAWRSAILSRPRAAVRRRAVRRGAIAHTDKHKLPSRNLVVDFGSKEALASYREEDAAKTGHAVGSRGPGGGNEKRAHGASRFIERTAFICTCTLHL